MSKECNELVRKIDDIHTSISKLSADVENLKNPMIYNYIDENMPSWARESVQRLRDNGFLQCDEEGRLGLTDYMLRMLVVIDRMNKSE